MKPYTLLVTCVAALALALSSCGDHTAEKTPDTDSSTMMTPAPHSSGTPLPDTNPIPPVDPAMDTAAGNNAMPAR